MPQKSLPHVRIRKPTQPGLHLPHHTNTKLYLQILITNDLLHSPFSILHSPITILHSAFCILLLSSCDFFYSTVPYNGNEEPPLLVVNALLNEQEPPRVYISRSFFFADTARYIRVPDSRYSSGYRNLGSHNGNLCDASACLIITNHHSPFTNNLHYIPASQASAYADELGYYTTDDLHLSPHDTVTLRVSHPLYGSASATQVCPDTIRVSIQSVEITNYAEAKIKLYIAPYHGNSDDVIFLSCGMCFDGSYSFKFDNRSYVRPLPTSLLSPYLYSYNNAFLEFNTYQSDYGYFAGQHLLLPASAIRNGLTLDLIADAHIINFPPTIEELHCAPKAVQLRLIAMACTRDYYMYVQSVKASKGYIDTYVPRLTSAPEVEGNSGDIIGQIADVFSELGGQEGTQIQCNIHGGIGHFCLSSTDTCYYEYTSTP
ncbi:MAG: DUF4249 family protein [Bacteroidales bacterium]|nr:DUF4249 family protein [Candidatus Colicola coprequi]